MDTDDYADDKKEIIYSEVRLPLFSHQTYTIKTTFNRNFTYKDTNIKDDSGNDIIDEFGNPIKKTSDNFATIYTPSLGENETHLLQSYEGKYYQKSSEERFCGTLEMVLKKRVIVLNTTIKNLADTRLRVLSLISIGKHGLMIIAFTQLLKKYYLQYFVLISLRQKQTLNVLKLKKLLDQKL